MKRPSRKVEVAGGLSESFHKQLNSYALAATAAGVSMLALAQPADAKIVYTAVHKVIGISGRYNLDFNNSGKTDVALFETRHATSEGGQITHLFASAAGGNVGTGGTGNLPNENAEGTVFKLARPAEQGDPWKETLLHSFPRPGGIDGSGPEGGLTFDQSGNLYGTTFYGAGNERICTYRGCGSAFQLSPPTKGEAWKETQLHAFVAGNDGSSPGSAPLLLKDKMVIGVTPFGGNTGCQGYGCGTIFEVAP